MLRNSIGFNSLLLAGFALVTVSVVAITYQSTQGRIAEAKQRAALAALYEIVPESEHNNDLLQDTRPVPADFREFLGLSGRDDIDKEIHIARQDGETVAMIIPTVAPEGYSGPIKMLVGVHPDGSIAGVRVTDHNETPGLGDYVEVKKSNWILSFNGKTLGSRFDEPVTIKKDGSSEEFDQLTGATITRNAVISQVKRTLSFFTMLEPVDDEQAEQASDPS